MIASKIYKTMIIIQLIFEPLLVSHLGVSLLLVFEQAIYYPPNFDLDISSKYDY